MIVTFCFQVYVEVTDVNDNLPRPGLPVYWPSIEENAPPNSVVVTLSAEDPDPHTQLSYAISAGNPQSLFSLDKVTGGISEHVVSSCRNIRNSTNTVK